MLLQVELEHRLLVALVSPAWVAQSSRKLRLMVELLVTQLRELRRALLAWREKVAARDAEELSQSPLGGCTEGDPVIARALREVCRALCSQ